MTEATLLLLIIGSAAGAVPAPSRSVVAQWLASRQPSSASYQEEQLHLGLLPFPVEEALLPGETKQVHLYEARFIQLFADAADQHGSCIGMLLFGDGGTVDAITPLLMVEEYRKQEFGVWAQLKCVGRARLLDLRQTEFEYARAAVDLFFDDSDEASAGEELVESADEAAFEALEDQVREVHESVAAMGRRLYSIERDEDDEKQADVVEWGHEVRDADGERFESLGDIIARRQAMLSSSGPDGPPCTTLLEGLKDAWVVSSEAEAQRQLLSFAACTSLGVDKRRQAVSITSTSARLVHALGGLREQEKRLAAMIALQQAGA